MENNNFENNIRSEFERFDYQLDNDEIWDNIEPHLKKKKKRRFFIWFFFVGLALFLIGYSLLNSHAIKESQIAATEQIDEASKNSPLEKNIAPKTITPISETVEQTSEPIKEAKSKLSSFTKTKNLAPGLDFVEKETVNPVEKSIDDAPKLETIILEHPVLEDKLIVKNKELEIAEAEEMKEENIEEVVFLEQIGVVDEEVLEEESEKKKKKTKRLANVWRYYFQPNFGPTVSIKELDAGSAFTEINYRNTRRESEQQLEAYSIGLHFQMESRRGLIFRSGLEFQRLNERFDYEKVNVEDQIINGQLTVTEDREGQIIDSSYGDKEARVTTRKVLKIYNHYDAVNFPIGIGKLVRREKVDLKVIGGLDFNLYSGFKGVIFNESGTIRDLRGRNSGQVFKKRTGLGLWLTTEFHRPINKSLSWVIAPKIQFPLDDITKDTYLLGQRYYRLSLNVGVSCFLGSTPKIEKR